MGGYYHIQKGKSKTIPLHKRKFSWYCGMTRGKTVGRPETNLVIAERDKSGRNITWHCYRDLAKTKGIPTTTKVRISLEQDKCGEGSLYVEGVGGFYRLSKGQTRFVPISDRRIRWYCGVHPESSTMPKGTNLLKVHRAASGREIRWHCYRENGALAPYRQPDTTKVYLGKEDDKCGERYLFVDGTDGFYRLSKGQTRLVPVSDRRFRWFCGRSLEWSTMPEGTNLVRVQRAASGREIQWHCYREKKDLTSYQKKDTNKVFLRTETDQCSEATLTVKSKNGNVKLRKGQKKWVRVANRKFVWYCGDTQESSVGPPLTNLIHVQRAASGREITWKCYYER